MRQKTNAVHSKDDRKLATLSILLSVIDIRDFENFYNHLSHPKHALESVWEKSVWLEDNYVIRNHCVVGRFSYQRKHGPKE